jgi:hypothetical protein
VTTETLLIRTKGGPFPGVRVTDASRHPWPLPATLDVPGAGHYRKVSESDLPEQAPGSGMARGAFYEWVPGPGESSF